MFYDMDDYLEEPSEAEEIILDAEDKLRKLLKESVLADIEKYKKAVNEVNNLQQEINNKKYELKKITEAYEAAKKKAEEVEADEIPRAYLEKLIEKYTGGFRRGDTAWIVQSDYEYEKCPSCNGEKSVTATINGKLLKIPCPTCNSYGRIGHSEYKPQKRIVKGVRLNLNFSEYGAYPSQSESILLDYNYEYERANGLFKTEEEAEAAAKKLQEKADVEFKARIKGLG